MILELVALVECDACGDEESFELSDRDDVTFRRALESSGWKWMTNYYGRRTLCSSCVLKEEEGHDVR